MMKPILLLLTCLYSITAFTQADKARSIELSVLSRYDKHADYTSRYGSRSYTNYTQLGGISYGFTLGYRYPITRKLSAKVAAGYYRFGINKVRQTTPFEIASVRNFEDHRDRTKILHSTSKYHYNTFPVSTRLQLVFPLKRNTRLTVGADLLYYFTYSQRYQRTQTKAYKTAHVRTLGWGANTQVGLLKGYKRFYVHPQVMIPLYQVMNGDPVFKEEMSLRIPKWFNGVGMFVSVGKYL